MQHRPAAILDIPRTQPKEVVVKVVLCVLLALPAASAGAEAPSIGSFAPNGTNAIHRPLAAAPAPPFGYAAFLGPSIPCNEGPCPESPREKPNVSVSYTRVWSESFPVGLTSDPALLIQRTPCTTNYGYGMGLFHAGEQNRYRYNVMQTRVHQKTWDPDRHVGDHLGAVIEDTQTGTTQFSDSFYALPEQRNLSTLWDPSVGGSEPPRGLTWQIGSGFAAMIGPPLEGDVEKQRIYAFAAPESEFDAGIGGHFLIFASHPFPEDRPLIQIPWNATWKDMWSQNDPVCRLSRGLPLRTLFLENATPVVSLRGDPTIDPENLLPGSRHFGGLAGWYDDGHFYLLTATILSRYAPRCGGTVLTAPAIGLILMRIRFDPRSRNGLALDHLGRPFVEIYANDRRTNVRGFVPLPDSSSPISFLDDFYPFTCEVASRQAYDGCCTNPPIPALDALLPYPGDDGFIGFPTAAFRGAGGDVYVPVSPIDRAEQARIMRFRRRTQEGDPFRISHVATVDMPTPAGLQMNGAYPFILPNLGFQNGTLIGFRHYQNPRTWCQGQLEFTVPLVLQ